MSFYVWGVAAAGWGLLLLLLTSTPPVPLPLLVVFGLLGIVTEWLMVPLPRDGFQSAGLAVATAGLLIMGPAYTALIMSVGVVIGNGLLHRRPYPTIIMSSVQYTLAVLMAATVFGTLQPQVAGLRSTLFTGRADLPFLVAFLASAMTYIVVSSLFVSGIAAQRRRVPILTVFAANIAWEIVNNLSFATLGLVLALIFLRALPVGAVILTIPLLLVGSILMLYTTREHAHREMEVIAGIGRASVTLDLERLFQAMYDHIRQVMPADTFYVALYDAERDLLAFEFLVDAGARLAKQTLGPTPALRELLQKGEPVLIARTPVERAQEDPFPHLGQEQQRSASLLFVPVIKGPQVIGVVSVQSSTPNAFAESDLRLLETAGAQVGAAVENARLFGDSRRGVERLTTLQQISHAIAGSLEMQKMLRAIAEAARQVLDVDQCAIYLGNEQQGVTEVYSQGLPQEFVEAVKRAVSGLAGQLPFNPREPLIVEDAVNATRLKPNREAVDKGEADTVAAFWQGVHTVAVLPLFYRSELLGSLAFYHDRIRPYNPEDVQLAQAIADQAAIAVKNATLIAQAQQHAAEVDLLNRVMGTVTGTLNLDELFGRMVAEVSATFGYPHVSIFRREGDYLTLQAQTGHQHVRENIHITKGITGRSARTRRPVLVPDVTKDRDYIPTDPGTQSEIAVPIMGDDQVMGVLNVEVGADRRLGEGDLELLQALARQLSVALRNATLYDEVKRARDELSVLYEAAKTISTSLELRSVLDSLVQVTCQAFDYEHGAILLMDERSGDLIVEATYGYPVQTRGYRVPSGKGVTGWVQRTGKPDIVPDVSQDARYISINEGIISEIAVPLISEGRVIGVFNVESSRRAAFGQRDLNVLTTLAGYATIAIENARLFEQTKVLAITDGLTELYNHRYLFEAMERALERCNRDGQPLGMIMLEVDKFKRYNDTYGHRRGDQVLRIVADLLRKGSRTSDFVARYGGDEFMIVLPNTSKDTAHEIAERLRRAVEAYPFLLDESIITAVTLSVGVAASPDDGETVDAIVDAVDRAQYTAKRSGGNKVHLAQVYR